MNGWKWVPIEPTLEMMKAGHMRMPSANSYGVYGEIYCGMLGAAPVPPAGEVERLQQLVSQSRADADEADRLRHVAESELTKALELLEDCLGPVKDAENNADDAANERLYHNLGNAIRAALAHQSAPAASLTNNSGKAHCPHCGICHTSDETCKEARARIDSLSAPAAKDEHCATCSNLNGSNYCDCEQDGE